MMRSVWVLTAEYNDYDQHGEYFVTVFPEKPSRKDLHVYVPSVSDVDLLLTKGGGRVDDEYKWWYLNEFNFKE